MDFKKIISDQVTAKSLIISKFAVTSHLSLFV